MQCLVTGGAGFIGSNLVRTLLARGDRVRVLDNLATGRRENIAPLAKDIDFVEGDIRDDASLATAMKGVEAVFHLAALGSVSRSVADPLTTNQANICGTLKVLIAARDAGVDRLVFSSSSSVYGDTPVLPKREDMTPMPLSPYAISKLTGEHYCRVFRNLYGLKAFALRYFNVFGPRQNPKSQYAAVIPLFIDALRSNQPPVINGDGLQTRDFTYVDDVVAANLACISAPATSAGEAYNVAWGNRVSVLDLATEIARILGKDIKPFHREARAGDVRDSQADALKARERLGWTPSIPFNEGLKRTVGWFLEANP